MNSHKMRYSILGLLVTVLLLTSCGSEVTNNGSSSSESKLLTIVDGHPLEEVGYTVEVPVIDWIFDPNEAPIHEPLNIILNDRSPSNNHVYTNGDFTSVDIVVGDMIIASSNISLRFLQAYKLSEFPDDSYVATVGNEFLTWEKLQEEYAIISTDDMMICDFTEHGNDSLFGGFRGYLEWFAKDNSEYDYMWIEEVHDYIDEHILEMIVKM